jgi:hypothetical protein
MSTLNEPFLFGGLGLDAGRARFLRPFSASYSPAVEFAAGAAGLWYDPSPSTCFLDVAGTIPAGAGDPVARVQDISGNGRHATQATVAARPTLLQDSAGRWFLRYDGGDVLETGTVDFSGVSAVSVMTAVRSEVTGRFAVIAELSPRTDLNPGAFLLAQPGAAPGQGFAWFLEDPGGNGNIVVPSGYPTATYVVTAQTDLPSSSHLLRVDGGQVGADSSPLTGAFFRSDRMGIGGRIGAALGGWTGRLYGLAVVGAAIAPAEAEAWMAARSGVTL